MNPLVVVMGVSGSGKSTLGAQLAQSLGVEFIEGDAHHPPRNVERMAAGIPLTDADREGWLRTLAERIAQAQAAGQGLVVSCSALKRSYRDLLRGAAPLRFVMTHASRDVLQARMAARTGHYMPASLLDSQLATLEMPTADEQVIVVDATAPVEQTVAALRPQLSRNGAEPR